MSKSSPRLNGECIELIPIQAEDFSLYREVMSCAKTTQFLGQEFTELQIEQNYRRILKSQRTFYFRVFTNINQISAGFVGAILDSTNHTAEIGFLLKSGQYRKGTGKEAAILLINYLFKTFSLEQVFFNISVDNVAAKRACLSIYTQFPSILPKQGFVKGFIDKKEWQFFKDRE